MAGRRCHGSLVEDIVRHGDRGVADNASYVCIGSKGRYAAGVVDQVTAELRFAADAAYGRLAFYGTGVGAALDQCVVEEQFVRTDTGAADDSAHAGVPFYVSFIDGCVYERDTRSACDTSRAESSGGFVGRVVVA